MTQTDNRNTTGALANDDVFDVARDLVERIDECFKGKPTIDRGQALLLLIEAKSEINQLRRERDILQKGYDDLLRSALSAIEKI